NHVAHCRWSIRRWGNGLVYGCVSAADLTYVPRIPRQKYCFELARVCERCTGNVQIDKAPNRVVDSLNRANHTAGSIDCSLWVDLILEEAVDRVQDVVDRSEGTIDRLQATADDIADGGSDAVDRGHNGRPIDKLAPRRLWRN